MALVYSYIRFSTKKQMEGDSLRRQMELGEAWIRKNGHTLADWRLQDLGVSAYRGRNKTVGKLAMFLEAVQAGRVQAGSILLVENLDRLDRSGMSEAKKLFEGIIDAGVNIACLRPCEMLYTRESIADPFGLLQPLMAFHLAYLESRNKADRLRSFQEGKRKKAAATPGYIFDKKCPSWLEWDDDKKTFRIGKWAEAVRYIYNRTAEGTGQRRLCAELNERFKGRKWNSSFIQAVLSTRTVLGERQPQTSDDKGDRVSVGKVLHNYYPAIIEESLWERCQGIKASNFKKKGPNSGFVNLFTSLVFNAHDGQPMHIQTTRGKRLEGKHIQRRLVSYGRNSGIPGSDSVTVAYGDLETSILKVLSEVKLEDLAGGASVSVLREREQELAGVERRLERIESDMAKEDDADEYASLRNAAKIARTKMKELRAEVQKLKEEANADKPLTHAHDVLNLLADADDEQRHTLRMRLRGLLSELLDSIYIKPEKHLGRVWVLVQLNFRSGLVKSCQYGPGYSGGSREQHSIGSFGNLKVDLRDKEASQRPVFAALAALLAKPAPAPALPDKLPSALKEAASLFLAVRKSELAGESFKTLPAKVKGFLSFVGDIPCRKLTQQHWDLYIRHLKAEVREKKLQPNTARINYSRVRELLRWLMDRKAIGEIDCSASASVLK